MQEKSFTYYQLGIKFKSFIDYKCRVWFKAKEVATILSYRDTNDAVRKHVSENHKRKILLSQPGDSPGQVQGRWIIFIDEAGFYELVFKSRLPSAKILREWVFTKVPPSIRKYGYYKMIDSRIKQRLIFDGNKYYKHPVFSNYASNKNGDILSLKTQKILSMLKLSNGYLFFKICDKKLEKPVNYLHHRFVYEVFKGPILRFFEVDYINEIKSDNRIKNLQLLTHKQNSGKSNNRPIISTNIETGKERRFNSIKSAAIELDINAGNISNICCKRKSCKTAKSKKDKKIYIFKFID